LVVTKVATFHFGIVAVSSFCSLDTWRDVERCQ
jgi:hypothetical protein